MFKSEKSIKSGHLSGYSKFVNKLIFKVFGFKGFEKSEVFRKGTFCDMLTLSENALVFVAKFLDLKISFGNFALWKAKKNSRISCYFVSGCTLSVGEQATVFAVGKASFPCGKCSNPKDKCRVDKKVFFEIAKRNAFKKAVVSLLKLKPINLNFPPRYLRKIIRNLISKYFGQYSCKLFIIL